MSSNHIDVLYSLSATEIKAYCLTLAQDLELTLESIWWGYAEPGHAENPYYLHISITKPFEAVAELWFTREEILGYATGKTKATVQSEIRKDLKARFCYDL